MKIRVLCIKNEDDDVVDVIFEEVEDLGFTELVRYIHLLDKYENIEYVTLNLSE